MSTVTITLTPEEMLIASYSACYRHIRKLGTTNDSSQKFSRDKQGGYIWDIEINSAMAELAVAKATGSYWTGMSGPGSTDVGENSEVRWIDKRSKRLIIRPEDDDNMYFFLVYGKAPMFTVLGYIMAKDGKRKEYLEAPNGLAPAYFVPQSALKGVEKNVHS